MRSEQIHCALKQGHNRFEICHLVAKGVRLTHRPGGRFEDSIGDVLVHLAARHADAARHAPSSMPIDSMVLAPTA